jgi:hypothetical protein
MERPDPLFGRLSDRVDEPFENYTGTIVRGNVEGVDGIFDFSDGGKLFVESKVINATTRSDKEVIDQLKKQFFKHLETKVLPLVRADQLPDGATVYKYLGNQPPPILDYHLGGSWFTAERQQQVLERFAEVLKDPRLEQLASAEPRFVFNSSNLTIGDPITTFLKPVGQ